MDSPDASSMNSSAATPREIDPQPAVSWLQGQSPPRLIDVREEQELLSGKIPGAIHIPLGQLPAVATEPPHPALEQALTPDESLLIYCAKGIRSLNAVEWLRQQGFDNCTSLRGGIAAWLKEGHPIDVPQSRSGLDAADLQRYARHLTIPQVGVEGQGKLLKGRVLVVGGGGLGCPAALYLAAAGVGTITIADDDVVEMSNLQRQVLYRDDEIGAPKAIAAAKSLQALNPSIVVKAHPQRVTRENASELIRNHDVVLDGADNFETRFLINDVALEQRKSVVHGSVYRFEGQVSVFEPHRGGPCFRCLHPQPPPEGSCASCAEAGVLGVMPGIVGTIQAAETIKLLLGEGTSLSGTLLLIDILAGSFRRIELPKRDVCTCKSLYQE